MSLWTSYPQPTGPDRPRTLDPGSVSCNGPAMSLREALDQAAELVREDRARAASGRSYQFRNNPDRVHERVKEAARLVPGGSMTVLVNREFHALKQSLVQEWIKLEPTKLAVTYASDSSIKGLHPSQASRERRMATLAAACLREELTDAELAKFREPIAYRVVRALLTVSGRAEPKDTLMQAMPTLEHWDQPLLALDRVDPQDLWKLGPLGLVLPYLTRFVPVPLCLHDTTSPYLEETLRDVFEILRECLGLDGGTDACPALGLLGCYRLVDNWPNPIELARYEEKLLYAVHGAISDRGRRFVRDSMLVGGLGYTSWEADAVILRSQNITREYSKTRDPLLDREHAIEGYEDVRDRAKQASSFQHEINALKEMSKAQGINHRAESTNDDLLAMHDELEFEEKQEQKAPRGPAQKTIGD